MLAASSGKRNITVCRRPSVCLSHQHIGLLNATLQGAARDAASVHFRLSITRTDRLDSH